MKTSNMKKAFTLLELVFVIVVLGIIAALAIPRMERDLRQEAADNILSAIRYTQHLALTDDKTDPFDATWQQKLWMIRFTISSNNTSSFYTISSDIDKSGSVNQIEAAIDAANGKYMYNSSGASVGLNATESPNIFIGKQYGINSLDLSGGCTAQHIAFDHLGRPHTSLKTTSNGTMATNTYEKYMKTDCKMTFGFADDDIADIVFTIRKETGYVSVE